jgi:crossover junction endodeoxyribonuclease RuvC
MFADLVLIEGYSYGSKFSHAHALGELGGVLKVAILEAGKRLIIPSPSELKKWATGKGNAGKAEMMLAAERARIFGAITPNDDIVDALWLAHLGFFIASGFPASNRDRKDIVTAIIKLHKYYPSTEVLR